MTGRLAASGAERKCSSLSLAPSRNSWKRAGPTAIITGRPMADHTESRPPTQSQKPKMRLSDRQRVVQGQIVEGRVCLGCRRNNQKKQLIKNNPYEQTTT